MGREEGGAEVRGEAGPQEGHQAEAPLGHRHADREEAAPRVEAAEIPCVDISKYNLDIIQLPVCVRDGPRGGQRVAVEGRFDAETGQQRGTAHH